MKDLLLLIGLSFSISAFSQNSTVAIDWGNGIFLTNLF